MQNPLERWQRWVRTTLSILSAELLIRARDIHAPLALACMAGACILLTPSADASYAVITFSGMKPVMSAGTTVVAAGTVFSLLIFPIYLFTLGLGCSRDKQQNVGVLLATSPVHPGTVLAARMLANALVVAAVSIVVLLLITVVILSRFGAVPDATSVLAFLLIVIPAGLCSVPAAAAIDRFLPDSVGVRAWLGIMLWLAIVTAAVIAWPDVFGLLLVKGSRPEGLPSSDVSLGIIASEGIGTVVWRTVSIPLEVIAGRTWVAAGAVGISMLFVLVAAPHFMTAISAHPRYDRRTVLNDATPVRSIELPRVRPSGIGAAKAGYILCRRWLAGARWMWVLIASIVAASIAIPGSHRRFVLGAALIIPLMIANARKISSDSRVHVLDLSVPALWRPSPSMFTALALAAVTVVPAIVTLGALPVLRGVHVLAGIAAMTLWLLWTCAGIAKPQLGLSIYALIWYACTFCDIPSQADLLGIGGTAAPSLGIAVTACLVLVTLLHRANSNGYRSSHRS